MAASDNINPDQLKMLMTGSELMSYITTSGDQRRNPDRGYLEPMSEVWARKEKTSREVRRYEARPLYESLSKFGYMEGFPALEVAHEGDDRYLTGGHHRVAAAAALEREGIRQILFPVVHINPRE